MDPVLKSATFCTFLIIANVAKSLETTTSNSPIVNVTDLLNQTDLDEAESNITLTIVLANSNQSEILPDAEALVGTYPHDFAMPMLPSISRRSSYDQGGGQISQSHNFDEQGWIQKMLFSKLKKPLCFQSYLRAMSLEEVTVWLMQQQTEPKLLNRLNMVLRPELLSWLLTV